MNRIETRWFDVLFADCVVSLPEQKDVWNEDPRAVAEVVQYNGGRSNRTNRDEHTQNQITEGHTRRKALVAWSSLFWHEFICDPFDEQRFEREKPRALIALHITTCIRRACRLPSASLRLVKGPTGCTSYVRVVYCVRMYFREESQFVSDSNDSWLLRAFF
jgi:hypothetical protein